MPNEDNTYTPSDLRAVAQAVYDEILDLLRNVAKTEDTALIRARAKTLFKHILAANRVNALGQLLASREDAVEALGYLRDLRAQAEKIPVVGHPAQTASPEEPNEPVAVRVAEIEAKSANKTAQLSLIGVVIGALIAATVAWVGFSKFDKLQARITALEEIVLSPPTQAAAGDHEAGPAPGRDGLNAAPPALDGAADHAAPTEIQPP